MCDWVHCLEIDASTAKKLDDTMFWYPVLSVSKLLSSRARKATVRVCTQWSIGLCEYILQ